MSASTVHPNKATEEEPERVSPDQARDTKGEAAPSPDAASESQAGPVHSTSAFKPDPFW
ncbi:MAG TPA: hypothetical protein VJV04_06165 [Nitrospiraceae bacterium]|nr:hypothetical protein [Nitrospiraceae bacterium]